MQKAGNLDTKEALFSLNRIQTKKDRVLNHQSPTTGHWHLLNLNPKEKITANTSNSIS